MRQLFEYTKNTGLRCNTDTLQNGSSTFVIACVYVSMYMCVCTRVCGCVCVLLRACMSMCFWRVCDMHVCCCARECQLVYVFVDMCVHVCVSLYDSECDVRVNECARFHTHGVTLPV